jgi:hypothetical protein
MCRLEKEDRFYVLILYGFATEQSAKDHLKKVQAALMWVMLQADISTIASSELQKVAYTNDPLQAAANLSKAFGGFRVNGPVDALLDGDKPAVYVTGKQVRSITLGQARVVIGTPAESFIEHLTTGIEIENCTRVVDDPKLFSALELYAAYFAESSANAKFLTLIMALETMATGIRRSQIVLDLLEKWKQEVDDLLNAVPPDSDDAASLQGISRELLFRREDSIRQQVRKLVLDTLSEIGDDNAAESARKAVYLYDLRSMLVHEGTLDRQKLGQALSDAKELLGRVLRARYLLVTQGKV